MLPIKKIKLHHLNMRLRNPFHTSFGVVQNKTFFITEVIDQNHHHGFGESVAFVTPWYTEETFQTTAHMIEDFLISLLRENPVKHPDDVTELFSSIRRNNMAKAALEGAIWDLYAKQQNITLAKALGGTKNTIDVGISIGMKATIAELLQAIEQAVQDGYKRVKLKIKPGQDIEMLREVRAHFPELPLMADANSAYTLNDIEHLKQLDDLHLLMIEQPLASDDIVDHAKLQSELQTSICLDESIHSLDDARKAVELGSCKVINVKTGRVGGLTEARRIQDFCQKRGVDVWCGGMLEAGVGRAHNIALTTLPGFTLPGDTAGSALYWEKDIISPEVTVENGEISIPDKPGIGYNIDWAAMEQYTVKTKTFSF